MELKRSNQTAREIAAEYEELAITSANQHYRLKQAHPFAEFPGLAAHVAFCCAMQKTWEEIAYKLDVGPEMYESDDERHDSEWGLM